MSVYTVHEPPPRRNEAAADPERFKFVRDGFHFWAFVFGPVWMLFHRLWLVFVLYVIFSATMHTLLWFAGTTSGTKFYIGVLISILIGLEAPTLRRWTLARRNWRTVGVVAADDAEDAERRFFDAWSRQAPPRQWDRAPSPLAGPSSAPRPVYPAAGHSQQPVIGLFPEPGLPR
jgi:hypothetical protein